MADPSFAVLQKVRNGERTFAITPRIPGGFISSEDLIKIAHVAEKYHARIKLTSGQRIVLLNLKGEDVEGAWKDLGMEPAVKSPYSVKNVEMCPAAFCKRAKQNSLKLGLRLEEKYYGKEAPNRTKIAVTGCLNACASAHAKDICVTAYKDGFIVSAGGSAGFNPRLADQIARGLDEDQAEKMVDSVFEYYSAQGEMGEKLGHLIDRIGLEAFKEGVFKIYEEK